MFPTVQVNSKDLATKLQNSRVQSNAQSAAGRAFIKFDFKTGDFFFGRDADCISGEEIVVNTASIAHGWVLWHNGTANKVYKSFADDLPEPMPSMGDDDPTEARAFEARFQDDPDTVLMFETNSYGGRKGVDTLLSELTAQSLKNPEYLFPVVRLESENYKAKQGGIIHNPIFTVTGWMNAAGDMLGDVKAIEEEVEEEAPKLRSRRRA